MKGYDDIREILVQVRRQGLGVITAKHGSQALWDTCIKSGWLEESGRDDGIYYLTQSLQRPFLTEHAIRFLMETLPPVDGYWSRWFSINEFVGTLGKTREVPTKAWANERGIGKGGTHGTFRAAMKKLRDYYHIDDPDKKPFAQARDPKGGLRVEEFEYRINTAIPYCDWMDFAVPRWADELTPDDIGGEA